MDIQPQEKTGIEKASPMIDKGWVRVFIFAIPYLFATAIFQGIGMLITGISFDDTGKQTTLSQEVILMIFTLIATFGMVWLFIRKVDEEPLKNLGFQLKGQTKNIGIGLLTGILIISAGFIILWKTGQLRITDITFDMQSFSLSALLFLLIALNEEILFRGYILKNLMASMNKYVALLVSSFIFALMHFANPAFGPIPLFTIFLAGVIMGLPYIFNQNLLYPIALHFSWNFTQAITGFNVSGRPLYSLIRFTIKEENNWNGGTFGFEGSLLCVILSVSAIVILWWYYSRAASKSKG